MTADGRGLPPEDAGAATAAKGTAAPVDVGVDPRARTTVAVLLAGPVILIAHFMVVYLVVEAGCTGDGPGLALLDPPVPTIATLVATGLAALACCASSIWAYRRWRPAGQEPEANAEALVDRAPLAFVGFLLSLLSLVTVLVVGLPALFLEAC